MGETETTSASPGPAPPSRTAKGETVRRELSKARRAHARRVAESKATVPHLYAREDAELADDGEGLLDRVVSACGIALREHPELNSAYRDGALELHSRVNVGFVTPGPEGPLVPTILDADRTSPAEIAARRAELAAAAAAGDLASPALAGGTFTVAAVAAPAGVDPIVAGGQAAALSVSAPRPAVVLGEGTPTSGRRARLALACDARVVGPDDAARFLGRVCELLARRPAPGPTS